MTATLPPTTSTESPAPFRNEVVLDFSNPDYARAQEDALRQVASEMDVVFPLIIGGERLTREETFASLNPANPQQIVARFAKASVEDANAAVEAAWRALPDVAVHVRSASGRVSSSRRRGCCASGASTSTR